MEFQIISDRLLPLSMYFSAGLCGLKHFCTAKNTKVFAKLAKKAAFYPFLGSF